MFTFYIILGKVLVGITCVIMHVEFSLTDPSSSLSKSTFSWDESGLVNITVCVISRSPAHNLSCSFFGKVCSNSSTSNDSFLEFFRLQKLI